MRVWGLVLLFTPKQTSFSFSLSSDPFDHHLNIGCKMEKEQRCNTSDFQSSVTLWRLPNKCLSSWKTSSRLAQKENRTKWDREAASRAGKWKKWRLWGLFVIAFPLRTPVRGNTCTSCSTDSWASVKHHWLEVGWEQRNSSLNGPSALFALCKRSCHFIRC